MGLIFLLWKHIVPQRKGSFEDEDCEGTRSAAEHCSLRVISGLCRKKAAFTYDVSVTLLGS